MDYVYRTILSDDEYFSKQRRNLVLKTEKIKSSVLTDSFILIDRLKNRLIDNRLTNQINQKERRWKKPEKNKLKFLIKIKEG